MPYYQLITWLLRATLEGAGAGVLSGFAIFMLQPNLQILVTAQPDPLVASLILIALCAQIGVLVSLSLTTAIDWDS